MAQREYIVPLTIANFPILTEVAGTTTINPRAGEGDTSGVPKAVYVHNVMPTESGYTSVATYLNALPILVPNPYLGSTPNVIEIYAIHSFEGKLTYVAVTSNGAVYGLSHTTGIWTELVAIIPPTAIGTNLVVTVGTVNGVSYIALGERYVAGAKLYYYSDVLANAVQVTPIGINMAAVLGVAASNGYLCLYGEKTFNWGSTVSVLDFTPSKVSGAGGGQVAELRGAITLVSSTTSGLIVHAADNTILASYTGNSRYPFKFKELSNSGGLNSAQQVTYASNYNTIYAMTSAGLQSITNKSADTILPELFDYLAGGVLEDFDTSTNTFTVLRLAFAANTVRLTLVASRYLVISYTVGAFSYHTHALVYDISLQRLGKLKYIHTSVIDVSTSPNSSNESAIGFLTTSGKVAIFSREDLGIVGDSVIIIGDLQPSTRRMITLQEVELSRVTSGESLTVTALTSLGEKGTVTSIVPATEVISSSSYRKFFLRTTGKSHKLVVAGKFSLNSMLVTYNITGRR